jgi:hypothetical protein
VKNLSSVSAPPPKTNRHVAGPVSKQNYPRQYELRLLAQSPLRYRRQILALKHFFSGRKSTVVLLDDLSSQQNDLQLHSIAHGVVLLEQLAIDYGAQRRRLRS